MHKITNSLRLEILNQRVWLHQELEPMERQSIVVTPDQLVQLIEWLRDAREELKRDANESA